MKFGWAFTRRGAFIQENTANHVLHPDCGICGVGPYLTVESSCLKVIGCADNSKSNPAIPVIRAWVGQKQTNKSEVLMHVLGQQ